MDNHNRNDSDRFIDRNSNRENDMSTEIWIAIGVIFVVVWAIIIYQIFNAPLMPDDYGIDDEYQQWIEDNTRYIEEEEMHEKD